MMLMSNRGRVTRIMCINCNICVNTLRRYRALELDIKVTTLLCSWVYPQIITEDDYICEACRDLAISVNHSLQEISGIDNQQPRPSPQGHTSVCLLCGCSLLRRKSDRILRDNPMDLHKLMFTIIENRVAPRQVTETDKVCHPCWLRTQREARRTYDVNRPQSATEHLLTADMPIIAEVQPSVSNEEDTHHDRLDTRTDSSPSLLAKHLFTGLDAAPPNTTEQDSSTNILLTEADVINTPTIQSPQRPRLECVPETSHLSSRPSEVRIVSQSPMPRAHVVPSTPPRVGSPEKMEIDNITIRKRKTKDSFDCSFISHRSDCRRHSLPDLSIGYDSDPDELREEIKNLQKKLDSANGEIDNLNYEIYNLSKKLKDRQKNYRKPKKLATESTTSSKKYNSTKKNC
ncbi:unnamed protein product [Parnassius apollo]|uniref:(apollo) hypothetical protein n=1 Tax=Parnassius apollo TaxID=110799 RepID=A0A8S3X019_PARAO|nr:unnamed protein product [Parnassius apollo]